MASTSIPYGASRLTGVSWERRAQRFAAQHLLLLAASAVLAVVAALLIPQAWSSTPTFHSPGTSAAVSLPAVPVSNVSPADVETVLTYARTMQPDDVLVQVRPGVFAKRSNVEGIDIAGRTVYYDVLPHQSFGPLRSGTLTEPQVTVHAREVTGGFVVLVYSAK
jgi:hypothetical protein